MTARSVTDPVEWSALLDRLAPRGLDDVYFRPAYCALYARPDDSSELFVFEMEGEVFALPWLVRPIESPAVRSLFDFETPYGYGGPLSTSSDPAFLGAAWNALEGHCSRRGIVCGFIRFHPLLENHRWVHSRSVTVVNDRQTVVLTLSKERDRVLADYSPDTRRNVRKGEKAGVKISVHTDAASLKVFACLYAAHMKELDAHDDYLFGEGYFNAVPTLGNGAWRVYLAERQGEVLGGALILLSGRWAHYHLSSSLKAHNAFAPNAMLRHAVTMDLLGKSQERLHYGGGRTAAADDSLLRFKGGFSPERAAFHFGGLICDPAAYEAICSHWAWTRPDLAEKYGGRFLRYRYK